MGHRVIKGCAIKIGLKYILYNGSEECLRRLKKANIIFACDVTLNSLIDNLGYNFLKTKLNNKSRIVNACS